MTVRRPILVVGMTDAGAAGLPSALYERIVQGRCSSAGNATWPHSRHTLERDWSSAPRSNRRWSA